MKSKVEALVSPGSSEPVGHGRFRLVVGLGCQCRGL